MRKTRVVILVIITLFGGANAFAAGPLGMTGLGVFGSFVGNTTGATGAGLGITAKWDQIVGGVTYTFADDPSFGVFVDYWVLRQQISGTDLGLFLGPGAFGGFAFGDKTEFDLGIRFPIGLQLWPVPKFELFIEGVPMLRLIPTPTVQFAADLGFRFHF